MPKPDIDLSFARYVAARKGEVAARTREGAAYAYAGDIKIRTALDRVRPRFIQGRGVAVVDELQVRADVVEVDGLEFALARALDFGRFDHIR